VIRITIELLPLGIEEGKRILGIAEITNIGGDHITGTYKATFSKWQPKTSENWKSATVENFPRTSRGAWDLLYRALREAIGGRNL